VEYEIENLMHRQGGVFTTDQAFACGMDRIARVTRLRRGELVQVRRGIYTSGAEWTAADPRTRHRIAVAAALLARGWDAGATSPPLVAGFRSAAWLWRLPLRQGFDQLRSAAEPGSVPPVAIDLVSGNRCKRTYRAGVEVRPAALPAEHIERIESVPVTSMPRTAVDLMRDLPFGDGVILADAVLRAGTAHCELLALARECAGWPGGQSARTASEFADGRAESPAESLARALCKQFDLPLPELQVDLSDARGLIGRVDLLFRGQRTILEVDGEVKYTDSWTNAGSVLWREKQREDRLRDAGWEVVRVTWAQLVRDPGDMVRRLQAAFARAQRRSA
jgi:hypothetical protein